MRFPCFRNLPGSLRSFNSVHLKNIIIYFHLSFTIVRHVPAFLLVDLWLV
jgi:hypothetical protein